MVYRILYVNLFPEIGGAETSLLYLIKALPKDFLPSVVVPEPGNFSRRLEQTRAEVLFLKLPGYAVQTLFIPGLSPVPLWRFIRLVNKLKPDIIHLNHLTQTLYAAVAARVRRIPIVATSWMPSDSVYAYQDMITQRCVSNILAVTPEIKSHLLRHRIIKENKIEVILPGIDTSFFTPPKDKAAAKRALGIKNNAITISIVSRFDPTKDHLTLLRAMSMVTEKIPNAVVLVAQDRQLNLEKGKYDTAALNYQINQYLEKHRVLSRRVVFTGYLDNMLPLYQATDILVSTSLYESLGMSLIEAASCGVPVIATAAGAQRLVIRDGISGFLVPPGSSSEVAEKIILLCRKSGVRKQFSLQARLHSRHIFSVERYVNEVVSRYRTMKH